MKPNTVHYLGRKPTGSRDEQGRRTYYVNQRTHCGRVWEGLIQIQYASWLGVDCKACLKKKGQRK